MWSVVKKGGVGIKVSVVYQDLSETGGTLAECFSFNTQPPPSYYPRYTNHWPLSPPPYTKFQLLFVGFVEREYTPLTFSSFFRKIG